MNVRSKTVVYISFLGAFLLLPNFAIAQGASDGIKTTTMIDSFGRTSNGDVKGRLDVFLSELSRESKSKGLIINHGDQTQIAARRRLIQNHLNFRISFRRLEISRISFRTGVNVGDFRTDVWLIPENAALPDIKPETRIAVSFERISEAGAKRKIKQFFAFPELCGDHQGYIINYGTPVQIIQREKLIVESLNFRGRHHCSRITLVNGGKGPIRTVMWLVPSGAENPKP